MAVYTTSNPSLNGPNDIATDLSGNMYITDASNDRIVKLSWTGSQLAVFTAWWMQVPSKVCVDVAGNIYVADWRNFAYCEDQLDWIRSRRLCIAESFAPLQRLCGGPFE